MRHATHMMILVSLLLSAAIFGFFYAWVCSTMWGLDAADPRVAIAAMQAMNASVRNAVFFPAFFVTPFALGLTALLLLGQRERASGWLYAAAAVIYFALGLVLTMAVNVPMNETLALVDVPDDIDAARQIWTEYSEPWQLWNQIRTGTSGLAFLLAALGALTLARTRAA